MATGRFILDSWRRNFVVVKECDTMEKMIYVKNIEVNEVNGYLKKGWKVKLITSVAQSIALGGKDYGPGKGSYGAYVVLEKEDE